MVHRPRCAQLLSCAISTAVLSCPFAALGNEVIPLPPLMLAHVYGEDAVELAEYWVSEKYDGIRAHWSGTLLATRSGHTIAAPAWFTRDWPKTPLDGELWIGRGRFEELLATVRDRTPNESAWRSVKYMAFDLPTHPGPFSERKQALSQLLAPVEGTTIQPVAHWRTHSEQSLDHELRSIVAAGGEGLVLRRDTGLYIGGRSSDLLKVKLFRDAEAEVIGHIPGMGKFANMLGALEVQTPGGMVFRIGTGFTDAQRAHPPAIGARVTYRYHGVTANGIPRFASFLRERTEDGQIRASEEGASSHAGK